MEKKEWKKKVSDALGLVVLIVILCALALLFLTGTLFILTSPVLAMIKFQSIYHCSPITVGLLSAGMGVTLLFWLYVIYEELLK